MSRYPSTIIDKANDIKLLILDVDGVLSDGKLYYTDQEQEIKSFNSKDGLGIKLLQEHDIAVAIITGRNSPIVTKRVKELGIEQVYQGQGDKLAAFEEILTFFQCDQSETAYMGDDLPDLTIMKQVRLSMTPADAHWYVKGEAHWSSTLNGGAGAVRDACDLILLAQNKLQIIHNRYQ